jgi:lysophospholipase L1-like esterase
MAFVHLVRAGVVLGVCALIGASAATSEPLKTPCTVSDQYLAMNGRLDRAAARLKDKDPFRILIVGSSSTAGVGATSPDKSYTTRLQDEMERRLPGVDVEVIARGIGGETAEGAEARLPKEIAAAKPDLVLWQIGTNDAARRIDLVKFKALATEGLSEIAAAGVDVAMLDPQYVPKDEAAFAPYLDVINAVSAATGVPVAHRFDAMRAFAKAGGAGMISRDNLHMNDFGHACVGAFLAEALDRKLAPLPPAIAETGRQS